MAIPSFEPSLEAQSLQDQPQKVSQRPPDGKREQGYGTQLIARALNGAQIAMAEAYIHGFELPDPLFRRIVLSVMPVFFRQFPALLAPYDWVLDETVQLAESSMDLMKVQDDLPEAMFLRMLGEGPRIYPKYSMGLWENGASNLEESQQHMLDQVIERLGITDGDHVLDLGCGWGCASNYILSKFPNARVTGVNLSHQQCAYIRRKALDPSSLLSTDRFSLLEADLNTLVCTETFGKILSIGLFEHIGNLGLAFAKIAPLLNANGRALIHMATVRLPNNLSSGFTHRYVFPHGRYWSHDAIPSHDRDLRTIDSWYINGMNHHLTLTAWLNRFDNSQQSIKHLNYGMDYAKFRRIWRFYLLFLGTIFESCDGNINGDGQYLMEAR